MPYHHPEICKTQLCHPLYYLLYIGILILSLLQNQSTKSSKHLDLARQYLDQLPSKNNPRYMDALCIQFNPKIRSQLSDINCLPPNACISCLKGIPLAKPKARIEASYDTICVIACVSIHKKQPQIFLPFTPFVHFTLQ